MVLFKRKARSGLLNYWRLAEQNDVVVERQVVQWLYTGIHHRSIQTK